jgi:nitrate reductase gamma subunit
MVDLAKISQPAGFKARALKAVGLCWALTLILCLASVASAEQPELSQDSQACVKCHAAEGMDDGGGLDLGPHQELNCAECHQGADAYPHDNLSLTSCQACHDPHNEEVTGDLHAGVVCSACHLAGAAEPDAPHRLVNAGAESSCQRCHHKGNEMGASAMVLPPKSALCLACHTATLSVMDWPSRIALGLLAFGLLGSLGFWLSGGNQGPASSHGHGHGLRWSSILASFFLDGLLQRRLWRFSPASWVVHALIFLPMVARTAWALIVLVMGRWDASASLTQAMLNKNDPYTALFFEITGLMILLGAALAITRRLTQGSKRLPGLPGPDWPAMGLLGLVVLSGFVTEAARLAMTGMPAGAQYAFIGAALSKLFQAGPNLQEAYGYLWYVHAISYAAFVAYLPFSRMRHILLTPLWLALSAGRKGGQDTKQGLGQE